MYFSFLKKFGSVFGAFFVSGLLVWGVLANDNGNGKDVSDSVKAWVFETIPNEGLSGAGLGFLSPDFDRDEAIEVLKGNVAARLDACPNCFKKFAVAPFFKDDVDYTTIDYTTLQIAKYPVKIYFSNRRDFGFFNAFVKKYGNEKIVEWTNENGEKQLWLVLVFAEHIGKVTPY